MSQTPQFEIVEAKRQAIKLLIGLFGKSGGGKTRTALMIARGLVGPEGRITLIDTERGRGSIFADLIPGGYSVLNLDTPFTPEQYLAALDFAMKQSDIVIMDSMSHEWSGEGGVLELQEMELDRMAGQDWKKRDACKMAAWIQPKMRHNKFVRELLRASIPVICCLRGKDKTHVVKEDGKTKVVTDDFSSPIYDADFIFEMLICGEIYAIDGKGGFFRPEKLTHPDVAALVPEHGKQFTIEHGAGLAEWARGDAKKPAAPANECKQIRKDIWKIAKAHFKDGLALQQWLWDEGILEADEKLEEIEESRLEFVLNKVEHKYGEDLL